MTNALKMAKTVQTIPDNLGLNPRKDRMLTKVITYRRIARNGNKTGKKTWVNRCFMSIMPNSKMKS